MSDESNIFDELPEADPVCRDKTGKFTTDEARELFKQLIGDINAEPQVLRRGGQKLGPPSSSRIQLAWWAFLMGIHIARRGIIKGENVTWLRLYLKSVIP